VVGQRLLRSTVVWLTWVGATVFIPIETYLSFAQSPVPFSGYAVNVLGVGIALWGAVGLRRHSAYAEGVLATGWGWTTAAAWRATNLRYWLADQGEPLSFGHIELWVAPVLTIVAGAALTASVLLLLDGPRRPHA
jgi:hypothetical protein